MTFGVKKGLIASLFLASMASSCYAGHYTVQYVIGGSTTSSNDEGSTNVAYVNSGGVVQGNGGISGDNPHILCTGPITAVFSWVASNASDQPPTCAILQELSAVSWDSASGEDPFLSGSGNDGMGDDAPDDGNGSGGASRTRYTIVQNPGATFTATAISPRAEVSKNQGRIEAGVSYQAALYAVWIDTTYTVNADEKIYAEAGRHTQANLSCALPGIHFQNYQWTVTGHPFKSYNPATASAHVEYMGISDWIDPQPAWYYYLPEDSVISCGAYAWSDDGALAETVNASKKIEVERVSVVISTEYSRLTDYVGSYLLITSTNPSVTNSAGEWVGMEVNVDRDHSFPATHFLQGGSLTDAQLILAEWLTGIQRYSTDGEFWLDNTFPFRNSGAIGYGPGGEKIANLEDFDSPAFGGPVSPTSVVTDFDDYILYKPEPGDSSWIPVARFSWTWNADSSTTVGQPDGTGGVPKFGFPEWDNVFHTQGGGQQMSSLILQRGPLQK